MKRIAVHDVAEPAGVSPATVDRVSSRGSGVTMPSDLTPPRRPHCIGIDTLAAGRVAASLPSRLDVP